MSTSILVVVLLIVLIVLLGLLAHFVEQRNHYRDLSRYWRDRYDEEEGRRRDLKFGLSVIEAEVCALKEKDERP